MSLEEAESFTSDQVTSAIMSCRNSRAYGHDSPITFHLKKLGPLATEHLTSLYNDSIKYCRLLWIWKTSLVIPIPKPGKDSLQGTSYRPISLLCPAAKVLEALILSTNFSHQLSNSKQPVQIILLFILWLFLWLYNSNGLKKICTQWNNTIRKIFSPPYQSHRWLLGHLIGQYHISNQLIRRYIKCVYIRI